MIISALLARWAHLRIFRLILRLLLLPSRDFDLQDTKHRAGESVIHTHTALLLLGMDHRGVTGLQGPPPPGKDGLVLRASAVFPPAREIVRLRSSSFIRVS